MKVTVDASAFLVPQTGVGTFTYELLSRLAARSDVETTVVCYGRGRPDWVPSEFRGTLHSVATPLLSRRLRWLWHHLSIPRVEWFAGQTDIFHGPNYQVPPTTKAATLVSVHDVGFEHDPPICIPAALAHKKSVRTAIRQGAWIHTDSFYVAEEVRNLYPIDPQKVITISPGVSLPPPGRHPSPGAPYILALGSTDRRKDPRTLVNAFNAVADTLPEIRLILAGPPGDAHHDFKAQATTSPHRTRIQHLGWVDNATKAALLHKAAAVAHPSRYEGFGFVPLEAMLANTPVVTTRAGSLAEIAGDAALLTDVGDPNGLAIQLLRAITDYQVSSELIARGQKRVAQFTWTKAADGFVDAYEQVSGI